MPAILSLGNGSRLAAMVVVIEEEEEEKNLSQQVSGRSLIMHADMSPGRTYLMLECARLRLVVEVPVLMMPEENLSQQVSAHSETMYAGASSSPDGRTCCCCARGCGGTLGGRLQDVVCEFSVGRLFEVLLTCGLCSKISPCRRPAKNRSWHCR